MAIINFQSNANDRSDSLYNVEEDLDRLKGQAKSLEFFDNEILDKIISHLSNIENGIVKVLDVGCADGLLTVNRFSRFNNINVLALDKSVKSIKKAKECYQIPHIKFWAGDIFEPKTWHSRFDFIFCAYVLPHIANQAELLKILWSYLKPGGIMLIRAGDDGWKSTYPLSYKLEWILNQTSSIPGMSDRLCGRKIPFYLQSLSPAPTLIKAYNILESTLGYSSQQKVDFFRQYYGFRRMYVDKVLLTHKNHDILKKMSKMQKYLQSEEQRFFNDLNLFSMVFHVSFIAYK